MGLSPATVLLRHHVETIMLNPGRAFKKLFAPVTTPRRFALRAVQQD
jgi:hypothetical protein